VPNPTSEARIVVARREYVGMLPRIFTRLSPIFTPTLIVGCYDYIKSANRVLCCIPVTFVLPYSGTIILFRR
jgi:hypothetical protein